MRKFILVALVPLFLGACDQKQDVNSRTPEQQKAAEQAYDMGKPTERSKSKGY
ncbi:hypothetical protein [Xanthomonas translucens]|uniref:hypothetical protein n=1 Tax=Xanthomonas campestris pv. translucens TaxID=343 RepID=UPI000AA0C618|nr:hypothetical protein [Xanthomonas translucens]MBC3972838.1 hypothetical protein [Xanthomonas translucens pv. undulosa]MCT8281840.1 hypothetical protein [Xanthomonas translucens pv. undulosa]MCT8316406.1 hypothetical protein [Xanthomonas translucens pv. undulosa]QSQ58122.1 hypothetical protein ISN37_09400 [Xanthomonas translucens pv. undulosa]UKE38349.1 hypothetical protein KCU58_11310 [Xanthomonas translucens pv. undulosa]